VGAASTSDTPSSGRSTSSAEPTPELAAASAPQEPATGTVPGEELTAASPDTGVQGVREQGLSVKGVGAQAQGGLTTLLSTDSTVAVRKPVPVEARDSYDSTMALSDYSSHGSEVGTEGHDSGMEGGAESAVGCTVGTPGVCTQGSEVGADEQDGGRISVEGEGGEGWVPSVAQPLSPESDGGLSSVEGEGVEYSGPSVASPQSPESDGGLSSAEGGSCTGPTVALPRGQWRPSVQ